uniref:Uncharacterized protein n=1 Tax=Arundo donax TaxID=35708 RepID=A0A0A9CGV3_ARUDO
MLLDRFLVLLITFSLVPSLNSKNTTN